MPSCLIDRVLVLVDTPEEQAERILDMVQTPERVGDNRAALDVYTKAFELSQEANPIWYLLNNNLGYCLNMEGRHQEAEIHCRAAIKIDPARHNAYKNLGIALQGQGKYSDAARSFMAAAIACSEDGRAFRHLEDLIAAHGDILEQEPELLEQAWECFEAAYSIKSPKLSINYGICRNQEGIPPTYY